MVGDGGADQAQPVLKGEQFSRLSQYRVHRPLAGRAIGVPRQAEATAAPATPGDLNETHAAEFRLGGKDSRMGGHTVEVLQPLAPDALRRLSATRPLRKVDAGDLREGIESSIATFNHVVKCGG